MFIHHPYTPENWYWQIGGDTSQVWSSALPGYVPATDQTYTAWLAVHGSPTPIPTIGELEQVFREQYPGGMLKTYNADARYRHASGGFTITSLSPVPFLTDPLSRNTINSAYDYLTANQAVTLQWKMSDGSFITMDKNKMLTVMNRVASFVQSCFTCESTTLDSITAGSVTTLAQIDAAFAAIANTAAS